MKKTKNKFSNLREEDVKEANEVSKSTRGMSNLTFEDIYGKEPNDKEEK